MDSTDFSLVLSVLAGDSTFCPQGCPEESSEFAQQTCWVLREDQRTTKRDSALYRATKKQDTRGGNHSLSHGWFPCFEHPTRGSPFWCRSATARPCPEKTTRLGTHEKLGCAWAHGPTVIVRVVFARKKANRGRGNLMLCICQTLFCRPRLRVVLVLSQDRHAVCRLACACMPNPCFCIYMY